MWLWYVYGVVLAGCVVYAFLQTRVDDRDQWLFEELERNKFKYRPGMSKPDRDILNRVGTRKWQETEQAQRRVSSRSL